MAGPIAVDIDGIFMLTKKILKSLQEFPAPSSLAESKGGKSAVTAELRTEIGLAARQLSSTTQDVVTRVNDLHDEIKAAVTKLVEADASMADEGKILLSLLASAEQQVVPPAPKTGSGETASNGAYR
ncbi:hypothetical protein [Microbacterium sp. 22242]|uniref:hypothetical protein n=1 Tax=Microbacterium sp. 22242 TaxID=3453896 RepID=UPI003F82DC7F